MGLLLALAGVAARLERRPWGWPLEFFGALVAYGSKEHAVVLPLLAAIEVCAHAGWPPPRRLPRRTLMTHVGPQLLLALGYVAWRQRWLPMGSGGGDWPGLGGRLGTVLETYGRYGVMALWPQDLSFGSSLIRCAGGARVVDAGFAITGALWLAACAAGALRRLVAELRAGQDASLVGTDGAVTFRVLAHSDTAEELARHPMTLAALEARLASRLSDDPHALALVREIAARGLGARHGLDRPARPPEAAPPPALAAVVGSP